jgi:hypothetical protein
MLSAFLLFAMRHPGSIGRIKQALQPEFLWSHAQRAANSVYHETTLLFQNNILSLKATAVSETQDIRFLLSFSQIP